ncbi:MAG TPA: hypothetical protein VKE41_18700 [Roseiflexaceae bacterium]|nr:hypothetical protein [Roseiflexaceae bacterium]
MKISTRQLGARAGPLPARRPAEAARAIAWPIALLVALALLHGLLYVALLPPWQTPDEPAVFEYAALVSELGRVPTAADRDLALERRIAESLTRQRFFEYLLGHPAPARDLEEARVSFFMPRQVGSDPPLYFILAALPLKLLDGRAIEQQLLGLRLLGAVMTCATVLCAYGAARELVPHSRGFALAVALALALQPMFVFIGAGAGNDGLANLIGAAICWLLIRMVRAGVSLGRATLLLALLIAGGLTKRTLLPETLLLILLALGWALAQIVRVPHGWPARLATVVVVLLALGGAGWAVLAASRAQALAADWVVPATGAASPRVQHALGSEQAALELTPGLIALQDLPDVAAEWAQNQMLHFRARVWTADGTGHGVIAIDFGWAKTEIPFDTNRRGRVVQAAAFVPLYCPYLHVALRSDAGTLYVDRLIAESDRRPGLNILSNGDVTDPAWRAHSALERLRRYLHWRELEWVWRSGRLGEPPPLGWQLPRIMFASFWGQFGWMSLPLVGGTPWEGTLASICLGGLIGTIGWLASAGRPAWQRRAIVILLLLIAAEIFFPLLNAYTQPRSQTIQQGRYGFPALAPIALLLVLGWRALIPRRWRTGALSAGIMFEALFALAALQLIAGYYY